MTTNWRCPLCNKRRQVVLPDDASYAELRRTIREEHTSLSPYCDGANEIILSWPGSCAVSYPRNKHAGNLQN